LLEPAALKNVRSDPKEVSRPAGRIQCYHKYTKRQANSPAKQQDTENAQDWDAYGGDCDVESSSGLVCDFCQ
jgi:hypothetical protein